jgi:hypothetical protein
MDDEVDVPDFVQRGSALVRVIGKPWAVWIQVALVSVPAEAAPATNMATEPASKNNNRLRMGFFLLV